MAHYASAQTANGPIRYVDPLIGTQKMGHTFPGATVPFGAVQLSPDTDQQNGKRFTVKAVGQGDANVYVKRVELNGKELTRNHILHDEIVSGGTLTFYMSAVPTKK